MSLDRHIDVSIIDAVHECQHDVIVNYEEISRVVDIELEIYHLH